jgi:uncharacterized protein
MKILTISDTVDRLVYSERIVDRFGDVDLILSCGDLPAHYLDYIVSMLNKPLYYVFGNHGPQPVAPDQEPPGPAGCENIDGRVVNHQGLLIAGFEGSMRYNQNVRYQYTEREMGQKVRRLAPRLIWNKWRHGRYLDILITHAPPLGIHDEPDLCHCGFRSFVRFLDRYQPAYMIHGHVHLRFPLREQCTVYGPTTIINTYGYQVIEIDIPPGIARCETGDEDAHTPGR